MISAQIPPDQSEETYFRRNVPDELLRRFTRTVVGGCASAYEEAIGRDPDFFVDAVPALRRLQVEPILSKMILPEGFEAEIIRTPSTHYTQISSDKIVITAVTRSDEVNFVKPYRYRRTLARGPQTSFFFAEESVSSNDTGKLYALLVYGGPHDEKIPTVGRFVFPTPDGLINSDGINLLSEYRDIVDSYRDVSEPSSGAEPSLKEEKKEEGEDK